MRDDGKARGQKSEDRGRKGKADGRGMMDEEDQEGGCQRTEVGEKNRGKRDDRCARMKDEGRAEVRSQRTEVGRVKPMEEG